MITAALQIGLGGSFIALLYSFLRTRWIYKQPVDVEDLKIISGYISDGAMAFLYREYRVLIPFVLFVALFLVAANRGTLRLQSMAFVLGAACSALAGFIGMRVATKSNARTANAAMESLNKALLISFSGGSVMGMSVVGLAIGGIVLVLFIGTYLFGKDASSLNTSVLPILSGFSLGASSIALFARVGGGIYTKAADVGADLVGKLEAGIPEDDPRNPATIADNVGDNVGDVAGMGADLFESYVGSIVGAMILGVSADASNVMRLKLASLPLIIASLGILSAIAGIFMVRTNHGKSPQYALNTGTFTAAIVAALISFVVIRLLLGKETFGAGTDSLRVFFSMMIGLAAGICIGFLTEYFTGIGTRPVKAIVRSCESGAATTLITGMGIGMLSSFPPILIIGAVLLSSSALAGLYGIAFAALGMLTTLGIQIAVDAYGPIADNAGGLAEMVGLPHETRAVTDQLDAVGNTTAAIGKGFAIGSAALTAIILFSAFRKAAGVEYIDLTEVNVLVGILIGAVIPYVFSSMAMTAIGSAAFAMIEEVRRQFKENPGILEDIEKPDYRKCIDISTTAALKKMLLPGIVAAATPVLVGFLGGMEMLTGLLTGVTVSGVVLAIFMANSGGAWDNAKKMIESGFGGGKGSEAHKAAVVGDTVGDPFKDTAGPSLNILIKLMAVVSLVIAPMLKYYWGG
ncbi:MAG: sodium-translocating pyrophosphatase [Spirochaetes bacterium]|nr:MAG: sodium-translocating pyrophosphatase [Spirochaetota bacterium]